MITAPVLKSHLIKFWMQKQKKNWILILLVAFFISLSFVVDANISITSASSQPAWSETNVLGWSWSGIATRDLTTIAPHIGWFSNNCYNYFDLGVPEEEIQSQCSDSGGVDYGLRVDPETGNITGYSWNAVVDDSGAVTGIGWIDFDPDPLISGSNYSARVEPIGSDYAGQMSGWIKIISMNNAGIQLGRTGWGWIELGPEPGPDHYPNDPNGWGVYIDFNSLDCDGSGCPLSGYAWSGGYESGDTLPPPGYDQNVTTGLGWVSFGKQGDGNYPIARYRNNDGELHGSAWVGNSDPTAPDTANVGWIALNCENAGANGEDICNQFDDNWQVNVDSGSGVISGYGWAGNTENAVVVPPVGWVDFGPVLYPDWPNFSARFFKEDPPAYYHPVSGRLLYDYEAGDVAGWARIRLLQTEGENAGMQNWGWVKMHSTNDEICSTPPPDHLCDYGVKISFDDGTFEGFAWSGGGTVDIDNYDNNVGLGWISFDSYEYPIPQLPPTYVAPFLETQRGDIFATEGVGSENTFKPPRQSLDPDSELYYNATFIIQSGGAIEQYTSSIDELREYYLGDSVSEPEKINPPLATNRYTNVMGKLDLEGLVAYEDPGNKLNKFGNTVDDDYSDEASSSNIWVDGNVKLSEGLTHKNGKVYYFPEDLTIDNELTIMKGDIAGGTNLNAAGIIVVEGDLNINKNISYDSTPITQNDDLTDIPSVAWIVKGNINIDSSVSNVVGAFIVVGKDALPAYGELDHGTGDFYTGGGKKELDISGLVITHQIFLQRIGIGTLEEIKPAEKITYDGRIIINTPPGLNDFAGALPVLREVTP